MTRGMMILGLNGCGKTTVGRAVAEQLGFFRMDVEDYYFPTPGDYTVSRTEEEVHRMMDEDAERHDGFVLSCVRCSVHEQLLQHVGLAVVLRTSPEIRAERIRQREVRRFGSRVQPGGDMYESQQAFHAFAAARTEELVNATLGRLNCPVMEVDAALPIDEIVRQICAAWRQMKNPER